MIKYLFSFLVAVVIVFAGCYFFVALLTVPQLLPAQTYVAIAPYSVIASASVRDFYGTMKQQFGDVDRVIIVSPNYSTGGSKKLNTRCGQPTKICFDGQCQEIEDIRQYISGSSGILHVYSGGQDNGEVFEGQKPFDSLKGPDMLNCGDVSFFQTGFFDLGHHQNTTGQSMIKELGIREHFRFIAETFSGVKVFLISISPNDLNQANVLISLLSHHTLSGKTLIIGLFDFSYHVPEPFAEHHDRRIWYELIYDIDKNIPDTIPYSDLDVDCPACLMTVQEIAKVFDQRGITLRRRDSSEQLLGSGDNTSRMFMMYRQHKGTKDNEKQQGDTGEGEKTQRSKKLSFALSGGTTKEGGSKHFSTGNKGITIAFFGDTIYDRWVHKMNPTLKDLHERLSGFTSNDSFSQHTLLGGTDMALLNLETPLVEHLHQCNKLDKPYSFCSHERIVQVLTEIHFDAVNIINNHSYDNRYKGIGYTTGVLGKWGLGYFGNFANYGLTGINIHWTGEVRGQKFVRLGYDLTITQHHRTGYIQEVRDYASRGFFPLVSVHWGVEYETKHNQFQEDFAHALIDAGAEVVIGHHPHVPQDTERYNGKPIVYSLGNFLFDQGFSEETKKGMYVLLDLQPEGKSVIWTGEVNAYYQ